MMKKEGHAISLHGLFELRTSLNNTHLPVGFQESMEAALFWKLLGNILLSCYTGNGPSIKITFLRPDLRYFMKSNVNYVRSGKYLCFFEMPQMDKQRTNKISAAKDKHKHACKHNCSLCLELQNSIFHMARVLGHNKCQWRRIQRGKDAIC